MNVKEILLKREVFERIKETLNDKQKEYIDIKGNLDIEYLVFIFLIISGFGYAIYFIINAIWWQNGATNIKIYSALDIFFLMVFVGAILLIYFLLSIFVSEKISDLYEYLIKEFKFKNIEGLTTLDFLFNIKDKISKSDYTEFFKMVKNEKAFKESIVLFMISLEHMYENVEKQKRLEKIKQEESREEENLNKKILLAEMSCDQD